MLKIASGPKFNFLLNGTARKPGIEMSFHQYDFGACFFTRQPMPVRAVLELTNHDDSAISIETNFEKKPYLDVQLSPGEVLLPSTKDKLEKLLIPIIFTPREITKYNEVVTLDFNGIYKIDVVIKGEGIPLNIELKDPDQHIVDFGIVPKGSDSTKVVELVNKSRKPIQFTLTSENPEDLQTNQLVLNSAISITPSEEVTLKPRKTLPIEVRFNPKNRMPSFSHDILLAIKGNETRKLFTVQGVSHGIELKLMEEVVGFGSVIKGSRLTKQLQLANFGDVRAKFKWDTKAYAKSSKSDAGGNFTISPESGYIPAHEDIYLDITFHPRKVDNDIHVKNIACEYTGGGVLNLSLMGKCIAQDIQSTIQFETIVRKATTQSVTIENPTGKEWRITPTISTTNDAVQGYFRGAETLAVPPNGSADFEVTYLPLTMTKEKEVSKEESEEKETVTVHHEAALFFPLPDGRAEFYNLLGKSDKPDALDQIEVEVEAKKRKYINIPIENWLKAGQRFKVSHEIEGEQDETTFIRGANTFDVQANSSKDYKLNFLTYKEGETNFVTTFKNQESGEYIFYNVKVTATEPGLQASPIELVCPVRETATKLITIENPTSKEIQISREDFKFENEYIEIEPEVLTLPAQAERSFEITYRPLVAAEETEQLALDCADLGLYKYELILKGLVSTVQPSLHFKCTLGAELMQQFKFKHYLKKATNYAVKSEDMEGHPSTCFKVEQAQVQAPASENNNGVTVGVNIRFEPNYIGESRALLKLTSPENIEYT